MKIYQTCPDIFELIVNSDFIRNLEFQQDETMWRLSSTRYLYFQKILIGEIVDSIAESNLFYKSRGINLQSFLVIRLLPNLEQNSLMKYPAVDQFISVLEKLLLNSKGWFILCEADCDQHFIKEIESNSDELRNCLSQLKKLFLGESSDCPTFMSKAKG